MSDFKLLKSKIINEAIAVHRKYGIDSAPILMSVLLWSKEHPVDGEDAKLPPYWKSNEDYGSPNSINGRLDAYRKKAKKKLKKRIYESYAADFRLSPIDSYCGSSENKKYWSKAGKTKAVREFLKYIDQVDC